jgi:Dolichyl-phosphate-mannose-protein mannosyltransferase
MRNYGSTSRLVALLVAISALGILLRIAAINRSYWFDELATVTTIDVPDWHTVLHKTAEDNQPPLYNSIAFAWTKAFGFSEIIVRSLSLLIGLAALLTPWLARTSLTRSDKLLNFVILCLMPLPIRYAQEARNYSLLFLLSSACLYSYYEIIVAKTRRPQILFHASLIALAFSHIFGLMLAVSFLAVMFWRERRATWRLGIIVYAAALSAAIVVPLLHGGSGQLAGGNFWITFSAESLSLQLLKVFTPVGLALLAAAAIFWWRDPKRPKFDPALAQVLMPFILMLGGAIIISLNTPILTERNLIGLIPAYALLTVWLIQRANSGKQATLMYALLCLLLVQSAALIYSPYLFIQQDFRSIAEHSIAADSKVCYVVPTSNNIEPLPRHLFAFYMNRIFNRPDLAPELVRPTEVPQDPSTADCAFWSAATLPKRGLSYLRTFPQFDRCVDVPLGKSGMLLASELLACRT